MFLFPSGYRVDLIFVTQQQLPSGKQLLFEPMLTKGHDGDTRVLCQYKEYGDSHVKDKMVERPSYL